MKRIVFITLSVIIPLALVSCSSKKHPVAATLDESRIGELSALANALTEHLNAADETSALALMDKTMQTAMKGKTAETWGSIADSSGAFVETTDYTGFQADGYNIIESTLVFENASFIQRTVFNGDNLIAGLFFRAGAVEAATVGLPNDITEEQVTVDAGSGFPLDGLLTLPKDDAKVAVLLVHGSGSADKDETVGANKPFRDIAYALAEKGIAVLRYDKRTFVYAAKIAEDAEVAAQFTVYDETIYDAVAAVKLLKERFERVFVLGHSMSGGLLSEISANGANCDGYIVMAGALRRIYQLSAEQNLLYADELEANGDKDTVKQIREFVSAEMIKAAELVAMSDEDALKTENAVFGISAWYLRSFQGIDAIAQHLSDGKPILVLQGGRDRQVNSTDFELWKMGLSTHPAATFKLYPTLNHLMGEYSGAEVPFSELVTKEYAQLTPVSTEVTDDIAAWILGVK